MDKSLGRAMSKRVNVGMSSKSWSLIGLLSGGFHDDEDEVEHAEGDERDEGHHTTVFDSGFCLGIGVLGYVLPR